MLISDVNAIGGFFIKYNRLFELNQIFKFSKWKECSNLDIYIDMNSATKELFYSRPPINKEEEIASTILNLCGHYRNYYRRHYQCETRFFVIYSVNRPKTCSSFFEEYNSRNVMEQVSNPAIYNMILKACSYLEALCKYIPDVFFIYSDYETYVSIFDSIEYRQNVAWPSLILSKDAMTYQILPFSERAILARPKKSYKYKNINNEDAKVSYDDSVFLTAADVFPTVSKYVLKCGYKPIWGQVSPSLLSLVYALRGLDKRSIPMLLNTDETFQTILDGITFGNIQNVYNPNINSLYDALRLSKFGVAKKDIHDRFMALDLLTQHSMMQSELSLKVDEYNNAIINLHDPDKVKYANSTTFANCPILLDNL